MQLKISLRYPVFSKPFLFKGYNQWRRAFGPKAAAFLNSHTSMKYTLTLAISATALCSFAHGAASQLVSTVAVTGGDGSGIISFAIDGSDAYAVVSGGGNHRIVKITDLGGANNVSDLVSNADWTTVAGSQSGIAGRPFISGGNLYLTDSLSDGAYGIDLGTGVVSTLSSALGNPQFAGFDFFNNRILSYDSTGDQIFATSILGGGSTQLFDDATLVGLVGDDSPTGIAIGPDGTIYFGQGTSSAGENIYAIDESGPSSSILASEEQIVGVGNDIGFSTTLFEYLGDRIYFRDGGTNDSFRSIDPVTGVSSLQIEIDEAGLIDLAGTDNGGDFDLYQGNLAFSTFGADGGIFVIPEPSSALLALTGGLLFLRRNRK